MILLYERPGVAIIIAICIAITFGVFWKMGWLSGVSLHEKPSRTDSRLTNLLDPLIDEAQEEIIGVPEHREPHHVSQEHSRRARRERRRRVSGGGSY